VTEAVIVAAARTPIGRSYKGSLAGVDAFTLAEAAVSAVIERAGRGVGPSPVTPPSASA
jgi:acetyl-CoA acetyltransferase